MKVKNNFSNTPDSLISYKKYEINNEIAELVWKQIDSLGILNLNLHDFRSKSFSMWDYLACLDVRRTIEFISDTLIDINDTSNIKHVFELMNEYINRQDFLCSLPDSCFLSDVECGEKQPNKSFLILTPNIRDGICISIELISNDNKKEYRDTMVFASLHDNKIKCLLENNRLGDFSKFIDICNIITEKFKLNSLSY